jgi:hypothetical protein
MRVHIEVASPRPGDWYVITEGTYLVGFRGLHARELAIRQQLELTALFNAAAEESEDQEDVPNSTVQDEWVKSTR